MALVGVELQTLVSEQGALTTRPPPCAFFSLSDSPQRSPKHHGATACQPLQNKKFF